MTPNKEDYLKCIHELSETHDKISNKKISEMMHVSAPAVSEMIKKMISENLIVKDTKLGYYLTKQGLLLVSELYRKHRLIEVFLVNHLDYSIHQTHQEAEVLEHTVSTLFIDHLDKHLDYPQFCPHGGTIPKKGELLLETFHTTLAHVKEMGDYSLSRVHDNMQLLIYLEQNQLTIKQDFKLVAIDEFAKTFTITYNDKILTIPENVAKEIYITKKDKD